MNGPVAHPVILISDSGTTGRALVQSETQAAALTVLGITGVLTLKGNIDASTNPNYPAALKGDLYYVTVAGKVGGASGKSVDVGDAVVAKADNAGGTEAAVGTSWFVMEHNLAGALLAANNLSDVASAATSRANLGAGDVNGPASASPSRIVVFDGSTGKLIKQSDATMSDIGTFSMASGAIAMYADGHVSFENENIYSDGTGGWHAVTFNGNTITEGTGTITTNNHTLALSADATIGGTNTGDQTAGTGLTLTAGAFSVNAVQAITRLSNLTSNGLVTTGSANGTLSITVPGTGVLTALAVNVGSAGAFVVFNGALGTPSSGTISTGVTVALSSVTLTGNLPDARNTVANSTTTSLTGAALAITPSSTGTINAMNIGGTTRGTGAFTTLAANGTVTLAPGTLVSGTSGFTFTATMPSSIAATNKAVDFQVTGAGNSSFSTYAMNVSYLAGYTGSSTTAALNFSNTAAGTAGSIANADGNAGAIGGSSATTAGWNYGLLGVASGGNLNAGLASRCTTNKNSATNIGCLSIALNTGSSPKHIGGYFGLQNADPTFVSGALIADNGSTTSDILVIRDNGTAVFTIADGGGVTATSALAVTGVSTLTGGIIGTVAGGNATAGNVGEYVSSLVASGAAVSLTTVTTANVTSISLTAGDWDVSGTVSLLETSATVTSRSAGITSTSATSVTDGSEGFCGDQTTTTTEVNSITLARKRFSISSTTTVYLVTNVNFSAGTVVAFGSLNARRVR